MKNYNHDLIHQLSELLDSLWRFEAYKKNAAECERCRELWDKMGRDWQEYEKIISAELKWHIQEGMFE